MSKEIASSNSVAQVTLLHSVSSFHLYLLIN